LEKTGFMCLNSLYKYLITFLGGFVSLQGIY
jgi:hypothetical protein